MNTASALSVAPDDAPRREMGDVGLLECGAALYLQQLHVLHLILRQDLGELAVHGQLIRRLAGSELMIAGENLRSVAAAQFGMSDASAS